MRHTREIVFLPVVFLLLLIYSCTDINGSDKRPIFDQLPDLKEIKPERPVKIKVKRNSSGSYSWDLSGNDAQKIIETDKELREGLE